MTTGYELPELCGSLSTSVWWLLGGIVRWTRGVVWMGKVYVENSRYPRILTGGYFKSQVDHFSTGAVRGVDSAPAQS